jgi:outer membrane receptor protein involved in Fe transport
VLAVFSLLVACTIARPATADDLADEADLQFSLGAERYREGDYRGALEHFLASNRLVPNRNVGFNIARSYEQLKQYPEAFRYYTQSLEEETAPEVKERVTAAIEKIKPHVAVLRIETDPPGATIYIDRRDLGPRGNSPRVLGLAPGKYKVLADLPNYEPAESAVVEAPLGGETVVTLKLAPKLEGLTGTMVVDADERGALIEVDGRPRAFTPAILTVPAGAHKVKISLKGFRTIEQDAQIRPNEETKIDLVLTQAEEVNAASRIAESVEDAPSSVTIIRSEELRGMGYPTIVEALRGVRGVFVSDDRSYATVGFRGLGRLGDYGNRVLVLLDGQPTNDDWIGSSYVGFDARTDLADIDRIEVVRGPGSVLYGTNAFSGVINLIPRNVEGNKSSAEVGVGVSDYGAGSGRGRVNLRLGDDAALWMSVAAARGAGRDFYFPEFGDTARNVDGFKSGTLNGRLTWKSFTATWLAQSRNKWVPTAEYEGVLFNDPRFQQVDSRGLVELRYEPEVSSTLRLMSRVHVNYYNFRGFYPRSPADGGLEKDTFNGSWVGIEQRVVLAPVSILRLTLGGELQDHFLVHQTVDDNTGSSLDDKRPFQIGAAYGLADVALSKAARLSAGARLDHYSTFGSSINPRVALIVRPYEGGNLKIMAGRAFRAPSIYELYYNDGSITQRPSPDLKPETIVSGEVEFSHRFSPTVVGTVATFGSVADNLVVGRGSGTATDLSYYENSSAPVFTVGGEVEIRREWRQGWMLGASYSAQHSRYLPGDSLSDVFSSRDSPTLRRVPNAPEHLASVRGAVPILSHALLASTRISVEGPRFDRNEQVGDPPQGTTDPAVIWDFVFSGEEPKLGLHYALGLYNAFDWRYAVPVSNEFRQLSIVQNGRTVLASTSVAF